MSEPPMGQVLPESARLQMLTAIGIDALLPRYQLDGALPSQIFEPEAPAQEKLPQSLVDVASEVENSSHSIDATAQADVKTSSMAARVLAIQAESEKPSRQGDDAQPRATTKPEDKTLASKADFTSLAGDLGATHLPDEANLALLEAGREFFIIDQIPTRQVFSKYQAWFLQEVLFAYSLPYNSLQDEQLRWPPKNMPAMEQPGQALLELLQGKIQALSPDLKAVLVLGQGLSSFAKALEQMTQVKLIYCPLSSAQVMMQPEQKIQMWQQLQALTAFAKS